MPVLTQAEKDKIAQNEAAIAGVSSALEGKVDNARVQTDVPAGAVFTDTTYSNVSELNNDAGYIDPATSNNFTAPQSAEITAEDNAIDFTGSNNFELTATAANITVGVMASKKGQEGSITVHSAGNITGWGTEFLFAPDFSAVTPTPPATPTGTMEFWYKIVEVNGVDGGTANKIHVAWAQ